MNSKRNSRRIVERIVIQGILEMETPAHFGNGEADPFVDLPLAVDAYDGRPVINGTSLAGALRNALAERLIGYNREDETGEKTAEEGNASRERARWVARLFGSERGKANERRSKTDERQSLLIVEDALATDAHKKPSIELRDGVRIDSNTGTAKPDYKYDLQLLPAGTQFEIGLELLVPGNEDGEKLRAYLATALNELAVGEILLGARKRRGFGKCKVTEWQVWRYSLLTAAGLKGSLAHDHRGDSNWPGTMLPRSGNNISALLDVAEAVKALPDQRRYFELNGCFRLQSSMLIRSGFEDTKGPDTAHLTSKRDGGLRAVIPGTSLAGVIRGRALKIVQTLARARRDSLIELVEAMFGFAPENGTEGGCASRVEVYEQIVDAPLPQWAQQRVRIDRWTGGALDTGLFAEAPLTGGSVNLGMRLRNPKPYEIALLLHIWKDLWTGDLPIGGEASVGRGCVEGESGKLRWQKNGSILEWSLAKNGALEGATDDDRASFEKCEAELLREVRR